MSIRIAVKRHHLIISKLRKSPATFKDILDYLDSESEIQGYDFHITRKTFRRDLDDIAAIYDIEIIYDKYQKVYYIEIEASNDNTKKMLEAFDVFNALKITERLSACIYFENNNSKGTENILSILQAIKHRNIITFDYLKYWENPIQRKIQPFALKEYRNLWYIVGKDLKDAKIKIFALDRITNVNITLITYQLLSSFDVKEYFKYSFGIMRPYSEKPKEVILSFNAYQGKYIKDFPLHHTQEILIDNDDEVRIKLMVFITIDFEMEIMKYGSTVKVLQPKELAKKVFADYKRAISFYK